jgi:hypothetical protein
MKWICVVVTVTACGNDHGDPASTPTYVEDIAPILQAHCNSCHGASTAIAEAQNCVRLDRWDTALDTGGKCTDSVMAGYVFGVHDADVMIVDQVMSGVMPFSGSPLPADELDVLERWRDAKYPRRSPNAPPTIQLTAPASACNPTCTVAVPYTVADPDGDTVTWSLGWSGNGKTGTFATHLAGGTGTVMIDASSLASGSYGVTATLDDGTATVTASAPTMLTIPVGHNAAPAVTVLAPNGGESYYDTQAITVAWNGTDGDDASLTYDVVAVSGSTTTPIATGLVKPVGMTWTTWTSSHVSALTAFRIQVTATDGGTPALTATDTSDADFSISPPPQQVSFASQVQPIFTANCTSAQCHDANMPQQGLNLTAGAAYAAIVGIAATECTSTKLVAPGQPDQSYLVFKLEGSGTCFTGSRMPKGAALTAAQIQLVRDWVANGAPNN